MTPLHLAAAAGELGRVEALLTRRVWIAPTDDGGRTPLALAVQGGHVEVVRTLVEAGADPDGHDGTGLPLVLAAGAAVRTVLLAAGADPGAEDAQGNGIWAFARSEEAVAALVHEVPLPSPGQAVRVLRGACHRPPLLSALLAAGVTVEVPLEDGHGPLSPLHHAARWGTDESLRLLLEAGADPRVRLAQTLVDGARVFPAGSAPVDLATAGRRALLPADSAGTPRSVPVVLVEIGEDPEAVAWVVGNHREIVGSLSPGDIAWEAPSPEEATRLADTLTRAGAQVRLGLCDDGSNQEEPNGRS